MKVQLNSDPSYFPKALEGIEKGFGLYSVADYTFQGKGEKINSANKLIKKISSFISKIPGVKVRGDSEVFLNRNAENINYLKENTLDAFTKNLLIQLNIDTLLNKVLKAIYENMSEAENSVKLKEVANSLSNNSNYMFTYDHNDHNLGFIQKGSLVVSANVSDPFFQTMISKIGLEKTFDFVFFHEAAHHMEAFADREFSHPENKEVAAFLNKTVNAQKLTNKNILSPDVFSPIRGNIAQSLEALKKEIYADTVSILTLRNRDIKEGVYNKEDNLKLVNDIKETRAASHEQNTSGVEPGIFYFTHSTAVAMDYLHEKIQNLNTEPMSMKEMDVFAKNIQAVALARTIHTLKLSAYDFIPQLNTIACVQFNPDNGMPFLEVENRSSKFIAQNNKLKEIAGIDWVDNLNLRLEEARKVTPKLSPTEVFNIGFSHKGKVLENLPDMNMSIENMLATRSKFLSSSKVQHKIT